MVALTVDRGDDSKVLFLGYDNKAKLRHECKWAYSVKKHVYDVLQQ